LIVVQHVAHGERQRIQIVLDAQQLERPLAIAVGEIGLQGAETGNLPGYVPRFGDDSRQRDDEPNQKAGARGRSARRSGPGRLLNYATT
jgi:hypothetical protein